MKYPVSNCYFGVRTTGFPMGINGLIRRICRHWKTRMRECSHAVITFT